MDYMQFVTPFAGAVGTVMNFVWICLLMAPLLVMMWYFKTYNIQVTIKEVIGNSKTFMEHKKRARIKVENGIAYLAIGGKINERRIQIKEPPAEALSFTKKGKKCITIFLHGNNPVYEITSPDSIPEKYKQEFFDTDAQTMYVNQLKKANSRDRKTILQTVSDHAGLIALTLIVICGLAFFDQVAAPMIKFQENQAKIEEKQADTIDALNALYRHVVENEQVIPPAEAMG